MVNILAIDFALKANSSASDKTSARLVRGGSEWKFGLALERKRRCGPTEGNRERSQLKRWVVSYEVQQ